VQLAIHTKFTLSLNLATRSVSEYHYKATQNQTSPLLRLPSEIRSPIFECTLDLNSDEIQHKNHFTWDRLNLSRTCRQIFAETASRCLESKLLPLRVKGISSDVYRFTDDAIARLTPSQKNMITNIVFKFARITVKSPMGMKCAVDSVPHLEVITIVQLPGYRYARQTAAHAMKFALDGAKMGVEIVEGERESIILR
jgi:hypothetical protein